MAGCSNYFTRICESYITYKIARHCPPSLLTLPLNFGGKGGGGRGGALFLFANKKIKLVMMPTYKLGYIVIHQRQQNINNRHWNQVNDCVHTAHILYIIYIYIFIYIGYLKIYSVPKHLCINQHFATCKISPLLCRLFTKSLEIYKYSICTLQYANIGP